MTVICFLLDHWHSIVVCSILSWIYHGHAAVLVFFELVVMFVEGGVFMTESLRLILNHVLTRHTLKLTCCEALWDVSWLNYLLSKLVHFWTIDIKGSQCISRRWALTVLIMLASQVPNVRDHAWQGNSFCLIVPSWEVTSPGPHDVHGSVWKCLAWVQSLWFCSFDIGGFETSWVAILV